MPAAPAGVLFISTITDENGAVLLRFQVNYDPATGALTGGFYTNTSGEPQRVGIMDTSVSPPQLTRIIPVPVTSGPVAVSAAALARNGYSTAADCNGFTFDLVR